MPLLPLIIAMNPAPAADVRLPLPRPSVESAVLAEINQARSDPAGFARSLRDYRAAYRGNLIVRPEEGEAFLTQEGVAPVDEAIAFVEARRARAPLAPAGILAAAAAEHQAEQGDDGSVGHAGRDGSMPADRVRRRGGDAYVGEVIAYGSADPADIVRQLVVDDGVADRGHRRLLFDDSLRYAGVACGPHPVYRHMCVVTLGRTPDGRPLRG